MLRLHCSFEFQIYSDDDDDDVVVVDDGDHEYGNDEVGDCHCVMLSHVPNIPDILPALIRSALPSHVRKYTRTDKH